VVCLFVFALAAGLVFIVKAKEGGEKNPILKRNDHPHKSRILVEGVGDFDY